MTATSLKKNITEAIDSIDDKSFLEALLTIVSDKKREKEYSLSVGQLAILDERERKHLKGESKSYKLQDLKKALRK